MFLKFERRAWTLIYIGLGVVDGGTAAVMIRALFAGQTSPLAVDLALGLASTAPAWSNLASFAYAGIAQGRPKVGLLYPMLIAIAACVAALALVPASGAGLLAFFVLYALARLLFAGVQTVRSVLWSVNYPRHLRARITGRIMVNTSIAVAAVSLVLGWLVEHEGPWYRWAIVAAALTGLTGTLAVRRFRVRSEQKLLAEETARLGAGATFGWRGMRQLLRDDPAFRHYMFVMSLFGTGNLMVIPLLVVCLDDVLHLPPFLQMAVATSVPILVIPIAIWPWAQLLDRHHVVIFRSIQGGVTVTAVTLYTLAILGRWPWLLAPGALLMGISMAAGAIGWNLGHNDFARRGEETLYMAVHVTLTGIRGLFGPSIAIGLYYGLESLGSGLGAWAMLLPLALIMLGAYGFVAMRREHSRGVRQK